MIIFETKYLKYVIDDKGNNIEFTEKASGRNVLKSGFNPCSFIVNCEDDRKEIYPEAVTFTSPYLNITYTDGHFAKILVNESENYLTFELNEISDENFWSIAAVNIVTEIDYNKDSSFVSTLMGTTLKTRMKEYPGRNSILLAEGYTHIGISTIKAVVIGAPENVLNSIMREVVDSIPDGTMPKAAYSGPYASDCPDADRTYTLRTEPITMKNVDEYIEKLEKFGISQVNFHQSEMFCQGEFAVNTKYYPNGISDLKKVIDYLHSKDIQCMLHTYTFFVQNIADPIGNKYIAPKPHKDLGVCARFTLGRDILPDEGVVPTVESTENVSLYFGYCVAPSALLWIDDEIIRFSNVEKNGFTEIERGVFGTTVSEHKKGAEIKQLNSYFNYIAPEKNSELFFEIARNNAEFYNECDFDGYYLDAIDGVFVLDGNEFTWYHSVLFINEVFKYLKKPPIFNCCYGPQYPGQWYARTRMGAFDGPMRGYRDFIDQHVKFNEKFAERMYLIGELGWMPLYPADDDRLNWSYKVMREEDLEYIASKTLATDVCQCFVMFEDYEKYPIIKSYSEKLQLYAQLQREKYFDKRIKDIVRNPYSEFELTKKDGKYYFRPTFTDFNKVQSFDDGRNIFKVNNRFARQKPKIRIEVMYTADNYDSPEGIVICPFDENTPPPINTPINLGHINTQSKKGIGVWVKGDGSGAVVNFRLRSPMCINEHGNSDHFVRLNFTDWRYFSFYEFENCEMKQEDFPAEVLDYKVFTDVDIFYASYSSPSDYNDLEMLSILTTAPSCDIRIKSVKALPHHSITLKNPALSINDKTVIFETSIDSTDVIEYTPETNKAEVYDRFGNLKDIPRVIGDTLYLEEGENTVILSDISKCPYQKRAAVTFRTHGDIIK